MKTNRVYADTSVFGGCFDEEFELASKKFFVEVQVGKFKLVISELLFFELAEAPTEVKRVLDELPQQQIEEQKTTPEILILREAYISAGILSPTSLADATHIAFASVAEVDLVISWNFKHIVHFEKIRGFNAINLLQGYKPLQIFTPREVIDL